MALTAGQIYKQTLAQHRFAYIAGSLVLLVTSVTEVMIPKFIQWTIDAVSTGGAGDVARLHVLIAWLGVTLLAAWVGRWAWRQLLARRTHYAGRFLKVRLWQALRVQPLKTFQDYPLGDLMSRATGDWNAARVIHGFTIVLTLDLIFFTVLAVGSMFLISVELSLYCLAIFPILPRFILRLARREHDQHLIAQDRLGKLSDTISQALGTIRLQRATAASGVWRDRLGAEARDYANWRFQVARTGWKIFPLGALPTLIAYAILLVVGVARIRDGSLTIGQFVALQSYVLMLQGPLFDMGDCISEWQRGIASLKRMVEVFNLEERGQALESRVGVPSAVGALAIQARDLTFAYDGEARLVLDHLDLDVRPGESIGILGAIGTGKSTLVKLIAGLVDAPAGRLLLSGADVTAMSRAWIAANVGVVPQRAFLFAGSIRYNLELDAQYTDAELWDVLRRVRLEADVKGFSKGLDTWIGEWGINLSGGQKQRLALARALLRPRSIMLLDDCLSAVDAVTEAEIQDDLARSFSGATVVWVAHRLSTLAHCDRIYDMVGGRLVPVPHRAPEPPPRQAANSRDVEGHVTR